MSGYVLLDRRGEFISWAAHVEVATLRARDTDIAGRVDRIERCSDGALIAYAPYRKRMAPEVKPAPPVVAAPPKERAPRMAAAPRPAKVRVERAPRAPREPKPPRVPGVTGRPRLNIAGVRFGRLVALEDTGQPAPSRWHCKCDCGVEKDVLAKCLLAGDTLSCGCLRRRVAVPS